MVRPTKPHHLFEPSLMDTTMLFMQPVASNDMVSLERHEKRHGKWTQLGEKYDCSYRYATQSFLSEKRIDTIIINGDLLEIHRSLYNPWEDDLYYILFHDKEAIPFFLRLLQQQQGDNWDSINIIEK